MFVGSIASLVLRLELLCVQVCSKTVSCCGLSPMNGARHHWEGRVAQRNSRVKVKEFHSGERRGRCVKRQAVAYRTKEVGSSASRFRCVRQCSLTALRGETGSWLVGV